MAQKKNGAKRPRKASSGQKASTAAPKRKKEAWRRPLLLGIVIVVGIALVAAGAILLFHHPDRKPVATTVQEALDAFRGRNVSEIVVNDLAADFASGNYTIGQLTARYPGFGPDIEAVDAALRNAEQEVLAVVNGYEITRAAFNSQLNLIPPSYRSVMTDDQILQEMINEQLIVQDAQRLGLTPSKSDIDRAYQNLLVQGNLTAQQLEENIASYGLTVDDLRSMLARQLTIDKVIAQEVDAKVNVTAADAQAFYEQNKGEFLTSGNVTVRHILIAPNATLNDTAANTAAEALAEQVLAKYKAGADFCTLVTEYSADAGSVADCGQYTFGKGVMVQPFEDAAFNMTDGETRIVHTQFGYHVMLKMGSSPGRQLTYGEVASVLLQQMHDQARLQVYQDFIQGLRGNATIVDNLANASAGATLPAANSEEAQEPVGADVTTGSGEESAPAASPPASENASGDSSASAGATVTVQSTGDIQANMPASLAGFASCLTSKGVVLYAASWDATSQQEIAKFGDGSADLDVVDCAAQNATCTGVQAYPTWKVGGKLFLGTMSLDELSQRTGCALD